MNRTCRKSHTRFARATLKATVTVQAETLAPCRWAAAGPGRSAGGRRWGLAGLRTPSVHQVPPVWRAPEGTEGQAAVPVGGGGAWPGFAATRRAKLAAQTARGRAAAHRHTQRPGPTAPGRPAAPQATQHQAPQHHARHTKNRHPDRMSACGGARGIRTPDLLIANETRYQLRHSPKDSNSLAPSQSAMQADQRRVQHDTEREPRRAQAGSAELTSTPLRTLHEGRHPYFSERTHPHQPPTSPDIRPRREPEGPRRGISS